MHARGKLDFVQYYIYQERFAVFHLLHFYSAILAVSLLLGVG